MNTKKVLLVLDNANIDENIDIFVPNSNTNAVLITSIYDSYESSYLTDKIKIGSFDKNECLTLFRKILKEQYSKFPEKSLQILSELFDNLPLSIDIAAHHLLENKTNPEEIINNVKKRQFELNSFKYGNKNLLSAIHLVSVSLDKSIKEVWLSLGVFKGKDFSLEAIACINSSTKKITAKYLRKLIESSLVEYSSGRRYRLHPIIRYYLYNEIIDDKFYKKALEFYSNFLNVNKDKINFFHIIQPEIRTIEDILEYFLKQKQYLNEINNLWKDFNDFLWFRGYWENYKNLNKKFYNHSFQSGAEMIHLLACTNLGKVYYWLGMIDDAQKYSNEAIKLANETGNEKFLSENKDRLGKILQIKGSYKNANKLFETALKYFEGTDEFEKKGNILRHIAEGYMFQKDIENSQKYLHLALNQYLLIKDFSIKHMYQALISSHSAAMFYKNNNFKAAKKLFVESLRYEKMAGGRAGTKIGSLIGLALICKDDSLQLSKYVQRARDEIKTLGIDKSIEKLVVSYHVLKNDLKKNNIYI